MKEKLLQLKTMLFPLKSFELTGINSVNNNVFAISITNNKFENLLLYVDKIDTYKTRAIYSIIHNDAGSNVKFMDEPHYLYLNTYILESKLRQINQNYFLDGIIV